MDILFLFSGLFACGFFLAPKNQRLKWISAIAVGLIGWLFVLALTQPSAPDAQRSVPSSFTWDGW